MRYPLAPDQIAHTHYSQRPAFDDELRNDSRWPAVGIGDVLVGQLRNAIAGNSTDAEGGSDEWRVLARALCSDGYEA